MSRRATSAAAAAAIVALVVLVIGAIVSPARAAAAYLVAYTATVSVVLGAMAMVMIAHVSGANWFVLLRREAEHALAALPALAVLALPLLAAIPVLYPWAAPPDTLAPALLAAVRAKRAYLDVPFFVIRTVVYWAAWIALGEGLRRWSLAQDRGDPRATDRQRAISAAGLPVLAFTLTFASFDWMMSLSPDWESTIYGVYWFAGGIVAALALLAVQGELARRAGRIATLRDDHFHALGKLLLTFVMFWAYIAYAQLLIIWIGDVPREVTWYAARSRAGWGGLAVAIGVGHFALPFVLLLFRAVKRSGAALAALGAWLLAMHVLDTYWFVLPRNGAVGWWDVVLAAAALAVVAGAALASALWRTRGESPVPLDDPSLAFARRYRTE